MINITQREKRLIKILSVVAVLAFVYFVIISPVIDMKTGSATRLQVTRENITKMDRLYDEFKEVRQKKNHYLSQLNNKNSNITSLIEQWAANSNIARNIAYTRRTQTNIQNKYIMTTTIMKVDAVAIEPLLKFIYEVENANMLLKISYIRIREAIKGSDTYDAELKINTYSAQ